MSPRRRSNPRRQGQRELPDRRIPFPVDIVDRGDEFVVSAELPGLRKQDLDISVRKHRLQIVADPNGDRASGTYLRRERGPAGRSRVVELPEPVAEKRVSASYDAGVLRVTLPKLRRRKRIDVE
ncbi:Hsp20/alpha crystallin family protein [Halomicroarcula limicola]|uniref:Hsp20/alpha crystallin family protein n=1 Tax=Haloarcula limicola TaxID=1429915 RepID=A0A8J7Y1L4_9EURY|nr:Hsp20/alpha crystallin family protein [Halomicroarcula limicola]MBV0923055.1 Hsp20/alpha crystallin family protein [Halomicroarcula limicola]